MPARDTRRSKRKTFDYVGLIDFRDGEEPRPCQIVDISTGGARLLVFSDPSRIPEMLTLLLSPTAKVQRACKVVWRSTNGIGVKFLNVTA
jgi:PilZ domain